MLVVLSCVVLGATPPVYCKMTAAQCSAMVSRLAASRTHFDGGGRIDGRRKDLIQSRSIAFEEQNFPIRYNIAMAEVVILLLLRRRTPSHY